jgi:hypothetical protein
MVGHVIYLMTAKNVNSFLQGNIAITLVGILIQEQAQKRNRSRLLLAKYFFSEATLAILSQFPFSSNHTVS